MDLNALVVAGVIVFILVCLGWCRDKIGKLEYKVNALEKEFTKVKYIDDKI